MNKKALIAAMMAGLVGVALLYVYMKRFEAEASGGPPVAVVMATQDIPLGAAITQQMIGIRNIPSAYVEERHIRAADAKRIVGVRVSSKVKANESVLWTDLATTTEQRRNLSSLVQNGMRAVTVQTDASSTLGGLLRPGDRVDILLTTTKNAAERVTVPLLQNVLVLAIGRDTGAQELTRDGTSSGRLSSVTLSVTVDQASVLTYAGTVGLLSLTLRNPDDIAILEGLPETDRNDILEQEKRIRLLRREKPSTPSIPTNLGRR